MLESKLKKILKEANAIREKMIENGSAGFYNDDFTELEDFLYNNLESKFFKNRKLKIIVNNFNEILPFIVQHNIDFILLYINSFIKSPLFKQNLIEGLKKYPYQEGIEQIFYSIYSGLYDEKEVDKFDEFIDEDIFNALAELNLSPVFYSEILNILNEKNQSVFLNILVENKCNISYGNIKYSGNNKQIIYDNLSLFIENSPNLYSLMNFVKDNETALKEVKEFIDKNEERAINSMFCQTDYLQKINDSTIKEIIKLIVLDIMKNEGVKFSDITYSGGGFSRVLLIGDKVLKIGDRSAKTFPNNPYIISPLLRRELKTDNETLFVEVTERVDTSKVASREELYQLYKNIRNLGLVWTDVKPDNVGRNTKDNIIHWRESLNPSDKVLNLQERRGEYILKEGDLVLLDADFIYDENDPEISYSNRREIVNEFEERYQREKQMSSNIESIHYDIEKSIHR